jgi:hypothetical protein
MLFPNNYATLHCDLILVSPKQRHIAGLRSMHHNSHEDARIICRWLFDETSYNYQGDVDKVFLPHTNDMGSAFRVDTSLPGHTDGFNCGVFLLGYVACVLYEMNPRCLTPMLVQGYRIRLFVECSSFNLNMDPICIKHHKGPPWVPKKKSRVSLDPIPATPLSPNKVLRAAGSSRRVFLSSERVLRRVRIVLKSVP